MKPMKNSLPRVQLDIVATLQQRFLSHMERHIGITWKKVEAHLLNNQKSLTALRAMERTGGEPDVVEFDRKKDQFIFIDCSPESPPGRRNLCYDQQALRDRKGVKPKSSALETAFKMGIELLTEKQYRYLQQFGPFDTKTSSWIVTPVEIRKRGGALFCDRRYDTVFTYHNGAESYYAARGFRGLVRV